MVAQSMLAYDLRLSVFDNGIEGVQNWQNIQGLGDVRGGTLRNTHSPFAALCHYTPESLTKVSAYWVPD